MSDPGQTGQPGQVSPDGLWRWDGARWVPTGAPAPAAPRGSFAWVWWLAGGCAVLIVVALVAAALGLGSLVSSFQHGGFSCLPSDFPKYPGASVTSENTTAGGVNECRMTLESGDDATTVADWYASHLSSGRWQSTSDPGSGTITFRSVSGPRASGVVQVLGAGQHSRIEIRVDT